MEHICIDCNKNYSSYKSLWFHKYKYHKIDVTQNVSNVTNDVTKHVTKCNNFICKKCNEKFNSRQTRWRHEKICDEREININTNKVLVQKDKEILEIKKEMLEYKKEMEKMKDIIQKSLKIHPPVFKENQTDSFGVGKNTSKNKYPIK